MKAEITRPLRVVAVSGGMQRPSKSAALAEHLLDLIADEVPSQQTLVEMAALAPQLAGAVWRSQLPSAVEQALLAVEQAMRLSPVRSGRYRRAWCVVVDGRVWTQDLARIPAGSEVMVLNPEPYARKIDTGGMKTSVPPGIVEAARQIVQRQYPNIQAERQFVTIPAGVIPGAPWILRQNHGRSRSRSAGQPITYPALVLKEKV